MMSPALAAPVRCPAEIKVEQKVADVPAELRALDSDARHGWINAQLSDGPPNEQAWLAPDSTSKAGKSFTNVWTLAASPGGTWLSCVYAGTSMILAWRLPDTIKHCEIRYDDSVSPAAATAIDCR